jgi:hypothetical protein
MGVLLVALLPAAAQAAAAPGSFFASNCKEAFEGCEKAAEGLSKEEQEELAEEEGYSQAAGHPPFGITDFTVATECVEAAEKCVVFENLLKQKLTIREPAGGFLHTVKHVRTDVAPGVSTNPFAVAQCTLKEFDATAVGPFFTKPTCSETGEGSTVLGENTVIVEIPSPEVTPKFHPALFNVELHGTVYNLVPREAEGEKPALGSEFGVALELPKELVELLTEGALTTTLFAHTFIEGSVEWGEEAKGTGKADYHDYFEIEVNPELPVIKSRLTFDGMLNPLGKGAFLTNGSSCPGNHTSTLSLEDLLDETTRETYETPVGTKGCLSTEAGFKPVPFEPGFTVSQSSTTPDSTDGLTTEVTMPHANAKETEKESTMAADSSQVNTATITLPPGLTLNSAAAAGLEKCSPEQFGQRIKKAAQCPEGSKIGTVELNVPDLPDGSLKGSVFLGNKTSGLITGLPEPFEIYVYAESKRYGIDVKLVGRTTPNEVTGQLTTTFTENPEQPFSDLIIHFNGGPFGVLANGLSCPAGEKATAALSPLTGEALKSPTAAFEVTPCAATTPFALTQSTENEKSTGGGNTAYTLNLAREAGQQYLEKIKTTLPEGLLGAIPTVTPCEEPLAAEGKCAETSRIGTATVKSGAGGIPSTFEGPVYFTGPYNNAPYGLSIAVPAASGPFSLGTVVTRSTINIDPTTSRVTAESVVPRIFKGVPLRIRSIKIAITKQGYLFNPTSCTAGETETTLTSEGGVATQELKSPFPLTGCEALAFTPVLKASTNAKFSKKTGAAMTTTITQTPGQANIKSVKVQLPIQLPSRSETLQKACLAATFEANVANCPAGSKVGSASVTTPTLPGEMKGPAYLVSHGGEKFPDLDLILEDKGVKIILVGHTDIKKGITTSTFESNPDAPISKVTVSLPAGAGSLLGANGDLCRKALVMPTTITAQNGKVVKQNTIISISGCGVKIVGHKVVGNSVILTVKTFAAGRISGSGAGLKTVTRKLGKATNTASLRIPLSSKGRGKHKPFKTSVRVGFVPSAKGAHSASTVKVTFR